MEILSFDSLPSTQHYLVDEIKSNRIQAPIAVIADEQTHGIGSRTNEWHGVKGNFFASFAFCVSDLPSDMPLASASIYFAHIMKEILCDMKDGIWLKWPNDIYLNEYKIGGVITQKIDQNLVCGIGINLLKAQEPYTSLDINISSFFLLEKYIKEIEKFPKWKEVFRKVKLEFENNREYFVHIKDNKKSLSNAMLCDDGSLILDGEKVFSLR
ncbi:MAG: biotin--[acetyl-CoA-carboxylase] ligase [Sulfurovaceae bacterium]|nr:biotin--[acetyl-CoA-carboxylase] ligase [Sulfurovaceae bacterium]